MGFFERRTPDMREQLRADEYERQLDEWTRDLFGSREFTLPVGTACCVECGRKDLLSVSTVDGRRVLLDATGAGRWEIENGLARIVATGGKFSDHNENCGRRG